MTFKPLQKLYTEKAIPELKKALKRENVMSLPRIEKVVVNVGMGRVRKEKALIQQIEHDITNITGQKPAPTKSRQSIAGFGLRQGEVVGMRVTLRGKRMYDFLDRLIHIALPRTRDFRGIKPETLDQQGNLSIGIAEQIAFPEVTQEKSDKIFGFQVVITTSAKTKEEVMALFRALQFPIQTKTT